MLGPQIPTAHRHCGFQQDLGLAWSVLRNGTMIPREPIPVPLSLRWREFRIKSLPPLFFLLLCIACGLLWQSAVLQGGFLGVAEGSRSVVTALQPGVLGTLQTEAYDRVKAGQPLAEFNPFEPRVELDLLNSEVQLARLQWEPTAHEEYGFSADRLLLEIHRLRTEEAVAQVNLARAENDVKRNQPLFQEKLVSEEIFDLSNKTRDLYRAEIETKRQAIQALEARFQEITRQSTANEGQIGKQERLASLLGNLHTASNLIGRKTLTAPIDGLVAAIYRRPGESVLAGEPLLLINSEWSTRVVGYLRQPYPFTPEIGQRVRVTTQERRTRQVDGVLVQIGAQVESITNTLAMLPQGKLIDAGLPLVVDLPADARIRPGEVVSLSLIPPTVSARVASRRNGASKESTGAVMQRAATTQGVASDSKILTVGDSLTR